IPLRLLLPALQQRYEAILNDRLTETRRRQLEAWAAHGVTTEQTQHDLVEIFDLPQGKVSRALADLEREGYVLSLPREGRAAARYVLTGASRLVFDSPASISSKSRRKERS